MRTARRRATSRVRSTSTIRRSGEGRPAKLYEDYEGMGDGDVLYRGRHRHLDRAAPRCRRRSSTCGRPAPTAAMTSGTRASPRGTSAARSGSPRTGATRSRRCSPSPTRCRRTGRSGRYLEAVGQHPWRPAHIHFKVTPPATGRSSRRCSSPTTRTSTTTRSARSSRRSCDPSSGAASHLGCDFDIALAPAGVSRFASCALGERRFAALVEGDAVAAAARRRRAGRRHAVRGARGPAADGTSGSRSRT